MEPLLAETTKGLYCPAGDFYVDPWQPVNHAVVTHAHADHARRGCKAYLAAKSGEHIFRMRLGNQADFQFVDFAETVTINGVNVSLYPAGHMTGSAQIRIEHRGQIVVASGDYKLQSDPTCAAFEPVRCHTFISESTFGLPIYRWEESQVVFNQINDWWRGNQQQGKASILFGYTVGKAQRLLSGVDSNIGPIFAHGAILRACDAYRKCGVKLPELLNVMEAEKDIDWSKALVVAPPSARGSTWLRRFGDVSLAMASGWMRVRGVRRRRVVDRGFVISDHVDWLGMLNAIEQSEADSVWVTHGYTEQVVRHLRGRGLDARSVQTQFRGELEDEDSDKPTDAAS